MLRVFRFFPCFFFIFFVHVIFFSSSFLVILLFIFSFLFLIHFILFLACSHSLYFLLARFYFVFLLLLSRSLYVSYVVFFILLHDNFVPLSFFLISSKISLSFCMSSRPSHVKPRPAHYYSSLRNCFDWFENIFAKVLCSSRINQSKNSECPRQSKYTIKQVLCLIVQPSRRSEILLCSRIYL